MPALSKAIEANDYIAAVTLIEYGVDVNKRGAQTYVDTTLLQNLESHSHAKPLGWTWTDYGRKITR